MRLEFDSIATARGGMDDGTMSRRLLSELLLQLTYQKHSPMMNPQEGDRYECWTAYLVNLSKQLQQDSAINKDSAANTDRHSRSINDGPTDSSNNIVVIAATNRLEDLDEAVVRRFESRIYIGVPDRACREKQVHIRLLLKTESLKCCSKGAQFPVRRGP